MNKYDKNINSAYHLNTEGRKKKESIYNYMLEYINKNTNKQKKRTSWHW